MARPTDPEADTPERRVDRTLLVLLLGTLASLPFTVQDFWDPRPDAARYLLAARSLADGSGYTVMGEPFRLRPPGFSALLAPLVAWRGYDFALLNAFVSLTGVLAVVLLYLLLRPRTGAIVACAVAALVWLNPQFQELCNQVMSDVPALALALLFLVLLRRANARPSLASRPAADAGARRGGVRALGEPAAGAGVRARPRLRAVARTRAGGARRCAARSPLWVAAAPTCATASCCRWRSS